MKTLLALFTILLLVGCRGPVTTPTVVVRPNSQFSKESSLTVVFQQDQEGQSLLEQELLRCGFNIISEDVANSYLRKELKKDDKVLDTGRTREFKSEYICKVTYHSGWKAKVTGPEPGRSQNYISIIRLKDGVVVISANVDGDLDRPKGSRALATLLEQSLSK